MPQWNRRSVLAAGASISTVGLLGFGSVVADDEEMAAFAAGHPAGWSSYRGNPANSRYLPTEGGFEKPDAVAWRYDHVGEIAVVDGSVYVQTDGEIHALDAADGSLEWETDVDATSTPAVADGTLFVTGDDHLTALDTADGSLEWDLAFETEASIPEPTVAFETVYLVVDGTLYAFDAVDGSVRWELETIDARPNTPWDVSDTLLPTSFRPETVAVANGAVYAALEGRRFDGFEYDLDCVFGAVDAMTGDRLWGVAVDPPHAGPPLTEPITATEHLVNANLGGGEGEYMFDTETGAGYYRERAVAAGTETTYVTHHWDASRMLVVDDQESRDGDWTVESDWHAWKMPLVVGDTLIADHIFPPDDHQYPYSFNSLVGFDIADGTERWVLELDEYLPTTDYNDYRYPALTAADENTLYIQTTDELVALRASETDPDDGDDPADEDAPSDEDGPADGDDSDDGTDDGSDDDPDCECEDENDDAESDSEDDDGDDGTDGDDGDGDTGNDDDRNGDGGTGDDGDETDDGSDDGSDGDGRNEDDSSNDGDDNESTDSSTGGDDDSDDHESVGNESDDENDSTEDDGMPGFTTGAGIVGGAATLEWLRRKADVTDSDGVDESTE